MGRYKKHDWSGKYQKILVYIEQGVPVKEIAQRVKMHESAVYRVLNKESFLRRKDEFDQGIIEKAREVFEQHAVEAAMKIIKIAKRGQPDERIQLDAAKEILYQVGIKPVEVIETRKREYTPEELESSAKVAREIEDISSRLLEKRSEFVLKQEAEKPVEELEGKSEEVVPEVAENAASDVIAEEQLSAR